MKKMTNLAAAVLSAVLLTTIVSCSNAADSPSSPAATTTNTGNSQTETPGNNQPENQTPAQYKVNISTSIANGSVTASAASAAAGTEITLTATPASGYVWSSYIVTGAGGAAVSVSAQGKFTMPASDVTVSATFVVGVNASLSNFASIVQNLTQDSTIVMTGQLTSNDLATIKSALQALGLAQPKIKLDLRGVTGLDSLPQQALDVCPNLQSLSLPEGLTSIGHNALNGCKNLESLYLPASFSSFDENVFDISSTPNVFNSINVVEGNPVYSSVDGVLFSKDKKTLIFCPKGKSGSFAIPSGVKVIGQSAFAWCSNLTGLTIPDGVEKIGERAFDNSGIASLELPDSVTVIENEALINCSSLTSLKLSANLTKIGDLALAGIGVESLELPNSVTSIGSQAFGSCGSLKSLVIPASVTSIGNYAFDSCRALTSVEFKAPSGWKRTADLNYWEWRTNGDDYSFSATDFAQNATSIKTTYNSSYWYK